ncbi:MAG TPA: MaoC/PaaZ C-terminal domain-containing protein [Miltoncostaeaceae bacterium]|nr:MaoC/PaaZ C-terminal domain-containing protein [Miltoncostaeaceae bacterium]
MDDGLLYLDDLRVGQRFTTGEYELDAEGAVAFASQWDPQPFHTDAEAAAGSLFGELVASGWHTAAITMRLAVQGLPIAGGLIGAGGEISWPAPTRPGAVLHVEAEVLEVRPSRSRPDRGMAVVRMETVDREGAVAQVFTVTMVVPRRPSAGDAGD